MTAGLAAHRFQNTWEKVIRDECKEIVSAYKCVAERRAKEIEEKISRIRGTVPFSQRKVLLEQLEFYQTQIGITRNGDPLDVEDWFQEGDDERMKTEEDVRRFVRWYHPIILGWK